MKQFVFDDIRIQLLGDSVLRIERAYEGGFCDRDTFFIPDRDGIEGEGELLLSEDGRSVCFGDYVLTVPKESNGLHGITVFLNGKEIYRYERIRNSGELPRSIDTPAVFAIADSPRILPPKKGYTTHQEDPTFKVEEDAQDIYLLLCEGDCKKLRRLYVELTGRPELVRLSTLGSWNSKYYPYNVNEAKALIEDYERHDVPLDVMVIDTDWRSSENGWGYDINTELFPDMEEFLRFAHERGIEIMFNDHPEPQNDANVFEKDEIAYREENLGRLLAMGLDIWWYDRNWPTHLISPTYKIRWETFGLYLFEEITKHHYQRLAGNDRVYRRPVVMGNVSNIINGSYQRIEDSASHRYSIQWTGDTMSDYGALGQEVENIIKTGDNCIGYSHPDCGGHQGDPDREEFVRWMQMGAFCPVLRPHCSCSVERFREPWVFDGEVLDIVREYIKLRYRLLPVIYARAFENYRSGAPIFSSLGYHYPDDEKAAECLTEYMLSEDILIAPITGEHAEKVPRSCYTAPVTVDFYNGRECRGEVLNSVEWSTLDMTLNHNAVAENVPLYDFSAKIRTSVQFDEKTELILICDDGSTVWVDGEKVLEDKTLHGAKDFSLGVMSPDSTHTIEIEYFQAGGEAACILMCKNVSRSLYSDIYFPKGKWLGLFDGSVCSSENGRTTECSLPEFPLFARLGALIPVIAHANNTHSQSWQSITYHYYPDKEAFDEGFVYEDDGESTAYKHGAHRISAYDARYDAESAAYKVNFHSSQGSFDGAEKISVRDITLAIHLHSQMESISHIALDGEKISFDILPADKNAMPFSFDGASPDSDVALIRFRAELDSEHTVNIFVK